ncbi:OsmC family protein [Luteibacter sp.]|uniref:OsmC family protein n=1 Tax=Luteibacter sp. TaxID=1886636 RepID=UPI003F823FD0
MQKWGKAVWTGNIKEGQGLISSQTGVLKDAPYGYASRFEDGPGSNPEELLGAAHAACFTMALSLMLGNNGLTADRIETKADVTLAKDGEGFSITKVHLTTKAKVPGTDQAKFAEIAKQAKEGCPVSKVLKAEITMDATLEA